MPLSILNEEERARLGEFLNDRERGPSEVVRRAISLMEDPELARDDEWPRCGVGKPRGECEGCALMAAGLDPADRLWGILIGGDKDLKAVLAAAEEWEAGTAEVRFRLFVVSLSKKMMGWATQGIRTWWHGVDDVVKDDFATLLVGSSMLAFVIALFRLLVGRERFTADKAETMFALAAVHAGLPFSDREAEAFKHGLGLLLEAFAGAE